MGGTASNFPGKLARALQLLLVFVMANGCGRLGYETVGVADGSASPGLDALNGGDVDGGDSAFDAGYLPDVVPGGFVDAPVDDGEDGSVDGAGGDAGGEAGIPFGFRTCNGCLCLDQAPGAGVQRMFCPNKLSWLQAVQACGAAGMVLARPRNVSDSQQIREQADRSVTVHDVWLNGTDREDEGTWRWADGSAFSPASAAATAFRNWATDEPNDNARQEDCLVMLGGGTGTWNDRDCRSAIPFVCEEDAAGHAPPQFGSFVVTPSGAELTWGYALEPVGWAVTVGHSAHMTLNFPPQTRSVTLAPPAGFSTVAVRASHGTTAGPALTTGFSTTDVVADIAAPMLRTKFMSLSGGSVDTFSGLSFYKGSDLQVNAEAAIGWGLAAAESRRAHRLVLEVQYYDTGNSGIKVSGSSVGVLGTIPRTNQNVTKTATIDLTPHRDLDGNLPTRFELASEAPGNSNPIRLLSATLRLVP